jgi:uncharacterized C2H2 Zn-finger protein
MGSFISQEITTENLKLQGYTECYHCKQFTSISAKFMDGGSIVCQHCNKIFHKEKIVDNIVIPAHNYEGKGPLTCEKCQGASSNNLFSNMNLDHIEIRGPLYKADNQVYKDVITCYHCKKQLFQFTSLNDGGTIKCPHCAGMFHMQKNLDLITIPSHAHILSGPKTCAICNP